MAAAAAAPLPPIKTLEMNLEKANGSIKARALAAKNWIQVNLSLCRSRAAVATKDAKEQASKVAGNRTVQVTAASAAGGAAAVGAGGAATGMLVGGVVGGAFGILPALFTLGLSIPISAAVGGACGLVLGGVAGGAAGGAGAGAVGYVAHVRRAELGAAAEKVRARAADVCSSAKAKIALYTAAGNQKATDAYSFTKEHALAHVSSAKARATTACGAAKEKATCAAEATKEKTLEFASDKGVQVAAASAAGGAAVLGTGGAATGLVAGGAIGAAVGLVPAVFTFGLSIPLFAAVGGGCGLASGAAVGSAAGAVGGGATGYGVYTKRGAIGASLEQGLTKADGCARYVKQTASNSANFVRTRLPGGTGSTFD